MKWILILLLYVQPIFSQGFKEGISVVQFNASFLSENQISLESIEYADTHLLLLEKNSDVFSKEKIVYLPTLILYHNSNEILRIESDISLKLPENSLDIIQKEIEIIIESKF